MFLFKALLLNETNNQVPVTTLVSQVHKLKKKSEKDRKRSYQWYELSVIHKLDLLSSWLQLSNGS